MRNLTAACCCKLRQSEMGRWRNNSSRPANNTVRTYLVHVQIWRNAVVLPVEIQKSFSMRFIAECLRSAGARDAKSTSDVSKFEAVFNLCSTNILVNKSGIKTVAGADRIDEGAA